MYREVINIWNKTTGINVGGGIGVANNLVTTQEGYSLDARQGKILNEYIAKVNANLLKMIQSSGTISNNTDWNNCLTTGIYLVECSTFTAENHAPVGIYSYGMLEVFVAGHRVVQKYYPHNVAASNGIVMAVRMVSGGHWNAWYSIQGVTLAA